MELLAVVTILGIIAALIVPRVTSGTDTAKKKTCVHNRTEINITVEQYSLANGQLARERSFGYRRRCELLSRMASDLPGDRRALSRRSRQRIALSVMPAANDHNP